MTGWALVSVVVVAALVGSLFAYLAARWRAESRWLDDIEARLDQAHRAGTHLRAGGSGDCLVCGAKEGA